MIDDNSDLLAIVLVVILFGLAGLGGYAISEGRKQEYNGPQGLVTNKLWVDDYWEGSEQLYPERFCLELDHREEICIPEGYWKSINVGDMYGVKK